MNIDTAFSRDYQFSKRFSDPQLMIMGQIFLHDSPYHEDVNHATDFFVLSNGKNRIASRGRRYSAYRYYPNDFTIRYSRESGAKTEFAKIAEGWGDYLFYFFVDATEQTIIRWILGDLGVFRCWVNDQLKRYDENEFVNRHLQHNSDGTTFLAFNHCSEVPHFVVESSDNNWQLKNGFWIRNKMCSEDETEKKDRIQNGNGDKYEQLSFFNPRSQMGWWQT